jgi:hypothetical protein
VTGLGKFSPLSFEVDLVFADGARLRVPVQRVSVEHDLFSMTYRMDVELLVAESWFANRQFARAGYRMNTMQYDKES